PYPANLPLTSPITYTFTPPAPDTRTLKVRLTDGGTPVNLLPDQTFTVTPGSGWAVSANMAGATNIVDQSYGVAPDPVTGGTYVYGTFVNTGGLDFGGGNRPLLGNQTFYLVKYDANGGYLWDRTWGRSSSGRAIGLTTDAAGNVYAGGTWATNLLISGLGGGAVDQVCGGGFFAEDHFILKFDPSGTYQALWRTNDTIDSFQSAPNGLTGATTSHGASPKSLLVNQTTGDVYYCGTWTGGTGIVSNFGIPGPTAAGGRDAWIVKLNSSLAPQWVTALHSAGGASNMYATALALDPTGNLIVTGAWDGATSQDYFGTGTPMASAGGVDAYVMRRNSTTGALVPGSLMTWGTTTAEVFECVTSDTNRMYIGGWTNSIVGAALPGGGTTPIIATGTASNVEGFVAAWNHSNTFQWQRVFTGQGQDMPNDLATNGTNLYACGLMVNVAGGIPTNLGYGTRSAGAGGAAFLVRFGAATGALDGWDRHWDTGGAGLDNALALNMSGTSLVMAGMWTGPLGT
ncbi:MAG TPA: hypothetical protein VEI97_00745, partial [bacterium]|nr:hypothetical protein [bacterium]